MKFERKGNFGPFGCIWMHTWLLFGLKTLFSAIFFDFCSLFCLGVDKIVKKIGLRETSSLAPFHRFLGVQKCPFLVKNAFLAIVCDFYGIFCLNLAKDCKKNTFKRKCNDFGSFESHF